MKQGSLSMPLATRRFIVDVVIIARYHLVQGNPELLSRKNNLEFLILLSPSLRCLELQLCATMPSSCGFGGET